MQYQQTHADRQTSVRKLTHWGCTTPTTILSAHHPRLAPVEIFIKTEHGLRLRGIGSCLENHVTY